MDLTVIFGAAMAINTLISTAAGVILGIMIQSTDKSKSGRDR